MEWSSKVIGSRLRKLCSAVNSKKVAQTLWSLVRDGVDEDIGAEWWLYGFITEAQYQMAYGYNTLISRK